MDREGSGGIEEGVLMYQGIVNISDVSCSAAASVVAVVVAVVVLFVAVVVVMFVVVVLFSFVVFVAFVVAASGIVGNKRNRAGSIVVIVTYASFNTLHASTFNF